MQNRFSDIDLAGQAHVFDDNPVIALLTVPVSPAKEGIKFFVCVLHMLFHHRQAFALFIHAAVRPAWFSFLLLRLPRGSAVSRFSCPGTIPGIGVILLHRFLFVLTNGS